MRLRRGSAATVAPPHSSTERNKTMKLTKTQIKEKQEADSRTRGGVRVAPSGARSPGTGGSELQAVGLRAPAQGAPTMWQGRLGLAARAGAPLPHPVRIATLPNAPCLHVRLWCGRRQDELPRIVI